MPRSARLIPFIGSQNSPTSPALAGPSAVPVDPPADMDGVVIFPSGRGTKACSKLYEETLWKLATARYEHDELAQHDLELCIYELQQAGHLGQDTLTFEYDPAMEAAGRLQAGMSMELEYAPKADA